MMRAIQFLVGLLIALSCEGAGAQGSSDPLPNCILFCKPQVVEGGLIVVICESTCISDEFQLDVLNAGTDGDPYVGRFSAPGGCPGACAPGAETFSYSAGTSVLLEVGLWAVPGAAWLAGPAGVTSVELSLVPMVSVLVEQELDLLPWIPLGSASLNAVSGFWELPWDTTPFTDPAGYLLRAELTDLTLGDLTAYNAAHDTSQCGAHGFGAFAAGDPNAGANVLSLSGAGGAAVGTTVQLVSTNVVGAGAFTFMSLDALTFPLFGGTIWIHPGKRVAQSFDANVAGTVTWSLPIPNDPALVGVETFSQSLGADPLTPLGFSLSNGLRLTFCP